MLVIFQVWSGHMGKPMSSIPASPEQVGDDLGAAVSVAFDPSGDTVAVGYHEGQVRVYDRLSGLPL
jgi:WD40 repeat protein